MFGRAGTPPLIGKEFNVFFFLHSIDYSDRKWQPFMGDNDPSIPNILCLMPHILKGNDIQRQEAIQKHYICNLYFNWIFSFLSKLNIFRPNKWFLDTNKQSTKSKFDFENI